MEIEVSWRDSRHGEKVFVERLLRGEKCSGERGFKERLSLWREQLRRERLREDSLRGEASPRREPGQLMLYISRL
jgi:hypothetical protein